MSGIAGIFYRNGKLVSQHQLESMIAAQIHRGPDGCHCWRHGSVGLVFTHLMTTPEGRHEVLPYHDPQTGLVITADARIDNRDELIGLLGLKGPISHITDSILILSSYKRWGMDCSAYLLGDFAFAIWDQRKQELFCSRDHIGSRPLYYHIGDDLFLFGSEINCLKSVFERPFTIDEHRVADYLNLAVENNSYTFHREVLRLPPATRLSVNSRSVTSSVYWTIEETQPLERRSNEEYAEEFRTIFFEAVQCRMRSIVSPGFNLSGGLDSSSVVCTAHKLLQDGSDISTFAFNFDSEAEWQFEKFDEREYQQAVVNEKKITHYSMTGNKLVPLENIDQHIQSYGEPFFFPHLYLNLRLWQFAREKSIRVMLDGNDGDSIVSHGYEYLQELARTLHFVELYNNIECLSKRQQLPKKHLMYRHMLYPFGRAQLASLYRKLKWRVDPYSFVNSILKKDFALASGVHEKSHPQNKSLQSARAAHRERLQNTLLTNVLEKVNMFAGHVGLEIRSPFMDRRVMEYCYGLPPDLKLNRGWSRFVLREALKEVVPDKVRLRVGKSNLTLGFVYNLLDKNRALIEKSINDLHPLAFQWINVAELKRQWALLQKMPQSTPERYHLNVYQCVMLDRWLKVLSAIT